MFPERFMQKVDTSGECWMWTAATNSQGYGRYRLDGKIRRAHVVSYVFANGDIPEGMLVLHSCDNPGCVRPEHLRCGSQSDNALDAVARGRHRYSGKTECVNGHPLNEGNTYMWNGWRKCRACNSASHAARRSAKLQED